MCCLCYRHASFFPFFYYLEISSDICFPSLCEIWLNKVHPFKQGMIRHIYDRYYVRTHVCVSFQCEKNARFNYREFDLEGDLVGEPHTQYLSGQSFITRLGLITRELDMAALDNRK